MDGKKIVLQPLDVLIPKLVGHLLLHAVLVVSAPLSQSPQKREEFQLTRQAVLLGVSAVSMPEYDVDHAVPLFDENN